MIINLQDRATLVSFYVSIAAYLYNGYKLYYNILKFSDCSIY
jgi:hypothetical protein